MDKLNQRQLTLIKRAAEDAIHACNRHYAPFVDVVAHPLNIIALVEMAKSRQTEVEIIQSKIDTALALINTTTYTEINRRMPDFIDQLKQALRGEHEN